MPQLSIIIVSFNAWSYLQECLRSIEIHMKDIEYEVIVVDNGSTENNVNLTRKLFPAFTVIANDKNIGFAAANNFGALHSKGKYLLFLNPDTKVLTNIGSIFSNYFEENTNVGLAGCKILNADGSEQRSYSLFPNLITVILNALFLDRIIILNKENSKIVFRKSNSNNVCDVDWVTGAFIFCDRDIFMNAGKFNTQYHIYYEDVDLNKSVKSIGKRVVYIPVAGIIHYGGKSSEVREVETVREINRSRLLYFYLHHTMITHIAYRLVSCFGFILRIFLLPFSKKDRRKALMIYLLSIKDLLLLFKFNEDSSR